MTYPVAITEPMYGYKVTYSARVSHNTKFHHNSFRKIIVHAYTDEGARAEAKAYREETKEVKMDEIGMVITVEREVIYSIEKVGKVTYKAEVDVDYENLQNS